MLRSAKIAPVFDYDVLERFWRDADELGYHAVWNYDHFYAVLAYGQTDPDGPALEAWTTLAAMGTLTKRARIGCMVTGVTYRHPAILAKQAVTVDHISGGRLEFGIGAAWCVQEHEGYGIPYPSAGTRIAMLDEACEIIKRLWTEDTVDHEGRFWTLREARCVPKPVHGKIPIVIGGSGERKTLRVVAKHADEWNTPAIDAGEFARLSGILDEHCAAVGRDPSEIRRSAQLFLMPEDEAMTARAIDSIPAFEQAGASHIVLSFYSPPTRELLASLAG